MTQYDVANKRLQLISKATANKARDILGYGTVGAEVITVKDPEGGKTDGTKTKVPGETTKETPAIDPGLLYKGNQEGGVWDNIDSGTLEKMYKNGTFGRYMEQLSGDDKSKLKKAYSEFIKDYRPGADYGKSVAPFSMSNGKEALMEGLIRSNKFADIYSNPDTSAEMKMNMVKYANANNKDLATRLGMPSNAAVRRTENKRILQESYLANPPYKVSAAVSRVYPYIGKKSAENLIQKYRDTYGKFPTMQEVVDFYSKTK